MPVKRLDRAKSRLRPLVVRASDLALAFATDTVAACSAADGVHRIVVVTSDPDVSRAVSAFAAVVPDPGGGLNRAIRAGLAVLPPDAPAAVLTGDLPALRAADLDLALLEAAGHEFAMVADHTGSGTTMITGARAGRLDPQYGEHSRDRHERAGHHVLDVPRGSALRLDVDTAADLETALLAGVGRFTARAIAEGAGAVLG